MRKVIGVGETVLDIIFKDDQPQKAVPGGSTFNCMISLSRAGVPSLFVSELGNDKVGVLIRNFMKENNLSDAYLDSYDNGSSPVALAFLDKDRNASYQFYRKFPEIRMNQELPAISREDILVISSYFAVNPDVRGTLLHLLDAAKEQYALIFYDINFRRPHASEKDSLMPSFIDNFRYADIIRGSDEDLEILFGSNPPDFRMEDEENKAFIITRGEKGIYLQTPLFRKEYSVEVLTPLSTIGAGDSFNAGLIYGLINLGITKEKLLCAEEPVWDRAIDYAKRFAAEVCRSYDNYVSWEFIRTLQQ